MSESSDYSVRAGYRLLDRDWIEGREIHTEPDPSRLRTACLMIYAGLLLSLGAVLSSLPANAESGDYPVARDSNGADGVVLDAEQIAVRDSIDFVRVFGCSDGTSGNVPICGRNCRVVSRSPDR